MQSEKSPSQKWALVTGASGGLGVEFAKVLAGRRYNVILVARREELLNNHKEQLKRDYGMEAMAIPMDLARENAPDRLHEKINERGLQVEVLVNNAGFGIYGPFVETGWEREREMLKLDMLAVTHLTKLFVKDMVQRDSGYILQISSIGAYQPSPRYATYSAAKSYVLHFGEALNYELRNTNVSCTVLSPGVTRTGFLDQAGQSPSLYQRLMMTDSNKVARIGIDAMMKRKSSIVPGFLNKLTIWSNRLIPRKLSAAVANFLVEAGQR